MNIQDNRYIWSMFRLTQMPLDRKTQTFSLISSVPTQSPDTKSRRDIMTIGKKRQSVLLCAWIACVFMFVLVTARMFYGADTTGGLKTAEGSLQSTPVSKSVRRQSRATPDHGAALKSGKVVPASALSSDSYYGHQTNPLGMSGRDVPKPNAVAAKADRQGRPSVGSNDLPYSILPDHVLNKSKARAKTNSSSSQPAKSKPTARRKKDEISIPVEKRVLAGPHWSQLPGQSGSSSHSDLSFFSQLPAHRQKEADRKRLQQQKKNSSGTAPGSNPRTSPPGIPGGPSGANDSAAEGRSAPFNPSTRISAFPIAPVFNPMVPNSSGALPVRSVPVVPLLPDLQLPLPPGQDAPVRANSTKALSISRSAVSQDFLTIPSGTHYDSFDAPLIEPPSNAIPNQSTHQGIRSNVPPLPPVTSGWSDFTATSTHDATQWWEPQITQSLLPERQPMPLTLAACLSLAQTQSPELQVLHSDWYIQQAESDRLAAAFDWSTFVEAIWNRDSVPVGSVLDGATNRLRSRTASSSFGVRRLTESGGQLELSQQFGTRSGNSIFLNPNPQANSRLALNYEKPLLRGFGQEYNTSPQKLAMINRDTAYDRFRIGVQDYLLNVSSAYWTVVLQRGVYLQSQASLQRVQKVADEMTARIEVDVTPGMLDRARSEVATRKANVVKAKHDLLSSQEGLLRLIYGSEYHRYANQEVVTQTLPMPKSLPVQPEAKVELALRQRSEVHQAIREIKAATIRYEVAANEVLPALNLVLSGYVAGLETENRIGTAWGNQFREGEPGVGIGFDFEVPYRNRAAEAAAERQQITIKRMQAALQTTIADVAQDVRSQVIERNKYGAMLDDQQEAIVRARSMLQNAAIRRENLADGNRVADLYLESLLQIHNRLESAESSYLQSQVRYTLADNALLRAIANIESISGDVGQAVMPVPDPGMLQAPPMQPATSGYSFGQ